MNLRPKLLSALPERTRTLLAGVAAFVAGCTATAPPPPAPPMPKTAAPAPIAIAPRTLPKPSPNVSNATNARAYRLDAAHHLYRKYPQRIYKGELPAMLYAVGVLQTDIDGHGRVIRTSWLRAPKHAPEVIAEIEKTVRLAAPYPAPVRMGRISYTETWLWHKSGLFQLHTLTEGQL